MSNLSTLYPIEILLGSDVSIAVELTNEDGTYVDLRDATIDAPIVDVLGRVWGRLQATVDPVRGEFGEMTLTAVPVLPTTLLTEGTYWRTMPNCCYYTIGISKAGGYAIGYPAQKVNVLQTPQNLAVLEAALL